MNLSLSLARTSADAEAHAPVALARCETRGEDWTRKLLELVGEGKRVLVIGRSGSALAGALKQQSCEVVTAAEAATEQTADQQPRLGLPEHLTDETFDVVVAANALEYMRDPATFLHATRRYLRSDGYVVARVPNVAHGTIRLALLAGQFPFDKGRGEDAPVRFFTYDALLGLFEKAGYAVGAVEREEEDVAEPSGPPAAVTGELLETVAAAPESRTLAFAVAAFPLPSPGLGWLQERMRHLAEQAAAARQEADDLRRDLDAVNGHVRLLVEQQEASLRREKELRAKVLEGHDRLTERDEEYRAAAAASEAQWQAKDAWWRDKDAWWQDKLTEWENTEKWWKDRERHWDNTEKWWHDKEAGWQRAQEAAVARERELQARLAQAEAELAQTRQQTQQMGQHIAALEARLERFRRSLPGRVFLALRGLVKRG